MSKSRLFDIGKVVWPYEPPGDKSGTPGSLRSLTNRRHFRGFHVQGSAWTAMKVWVSPSHGREVEFILALTRGVKLCIEFSYPQAVFDKFDMAHLVEATLRLQW